MKLACLLILITFSSWVFAACQKQQLEPELRENQTAMERMDTQIPDEDKLLVEITPNLKMDLQKEAYDYSGILKDVTGGKSTGVVMATYQDEMFKLQANFENLPQLVKNTFYEGWLVRTEPFHYISIGPLVQEKEGWANYYASGTNLTDHTVYVVTTEPTNDDPLGEIDPAPAQHLLEGEISKL